MNMKKFLFRFLAAAGIVAALAFQTTWAEEKGHAVHWSYEGATGPDHWGEFFKTCGTGKSQSPIDIKEPLKETSTPIIIDYKKSVLKVLNNGHTIQVNYEAGSSITIDGIKYNLIQFHFHRPSEERINGERKAMVAHFVHKSDKGKLAVIGVLLEKGDENALMKTIWANLPKEENKEVVIKDIKIDASGLMPKNLAYYHFMGSLTTPPCTEDVAFYIMQNTVNISDAQVEAFPFKMNARPTQDLNGRDVFKSK